MGDEFAPEVKEGLRQTYDDKILVEQLILEQHGVAPHYESTMKLPKTGIEVDVSIYRMDGAYDDSIEDPFSWIRCDFDENVSDAVIGVDYSAVNDWIGENIGQKAKEGGIKPRFHPDHEETSLTYDILSGDRVETRKLTEELLKDIDNKMDNYVLE